MNQNNKKALAEKIRNELNSPEYIAMPDLISGGDYHGYILDLDLKDMDGWIWNMRKGSSWRKVKQSQLEPNDWEEIINLIEKRNQERGQNWKAKNEKIEQKLNSRSDLYYYWGKGDLQKKRNGKADGWHENKGMRGFVTFLGGNGNGLTHHLYIAENHPVLDSFSFQTGFYLIDNDKKVEKLVGHYKGGFGCSGGETNSNNWQKYAEASDQITITPYEVVDKLVEIPNKSDKPSGNEKLPDKVEKEITNWLVQYFQKNDIKEISLKNGELTITNNNKVLNSEQVNNNSELRNIQNLLQQKGIQSLNRQDLNITNSQNSPNSQKPDYTPYLLTGTIVIGLVSLVAASYYLGKKGSKKKSY